MLPISIKQNFTHLGGTDEQYDSLKMDTAKETFKRGKLPTELEASKRPGNFGSSFQTLTEKEIQARQAKRKKEEDKVGQERKKFEADPMRLHTRQIYSARTVPKSQRLEQTNEQEVEDDDDQSAEKEGVISFDRLDPESSL